MKRSLLFLLLLFFGCKTEEEKPVAPPEQEEFVISSPKEEVQPKQTQIIKPQKKVSPTPSLPTPKPEPVKVEIETPIEPPKQEPKEEPTEEIQTALNRTVFEESFGWQAMNAVPMPAPPKHPDSLKWEDISGGYGAYLPPPTPWWIRWLGYINAAAAVILCGYLLITNG
jgi:hypothetical protein